MAEETLKAKTSKGLFWGGTGSLIQQLLNAFFGIFLARTLAPSDYGIVGMIAVFSLISLALQEGGFGAALINKKEVRSEDYNAVFWFNLLIAFACYLILFFSAPLIARYFHQPVLVEVSRWQFLCIVLSGFGTAQKAYLTKHLKVKEQSIITILSVAISGVVGVILAFKGFGYWALVIQALIMNVIFNFGPWFVSEWKPTLHIDFKPIKGMIKFSIKLLINSFLSILSGSLITIVLGRFYSAAKVGFYTQANKWSGMGTSVLSSMIGSVSHPVLVQVSDDKERQLRVFRKLIRFAAFVSFPAMFGLAFIAPEFIVIAIKDKWMESIPLLQILCVAGAFAPISGILSTLIVTYGKSDTILWTNIALSLSTILVLYLAFPYGITYMVIGIAALNILWVFVWWFLSHTKSGYSILGLFSDLVPFMGIAAFSIALAWILTKWIANIYLLLIAKILVTGVIYLILMKVSRAVAYKESKEYIRKYWLYRGQQ